MVSINCLTLINHETIYGVKVKRIVTHFDTISVKPPKYLGKI